MFAAWSDILAAQLVRLMIPMQEVSSSIPVTFQKLDHPQQYLLTMTVLSTQLTLK